MTDRRQKIKLEDASKSEIIRAIDREFAISDVRRRIENEVRSIRVDDLLAKLSKECDEMEANRQLEGKFDKLRYARWNAANRRWNQINNVLSKLQGI